MSIRFVGYPTRRTTGSLDSFTWAEIKDISYNGRAQQLFSVGDTKDGATLIGFNTMYRHQCIFSLGNVGNACIASYGSVPWPSPSALPSYMDVTRLGWYQGTSYASSRGITRSSVLASLPQDLRNVMATNVSKECGFRNSNSSNPETKYLSFDLYPPNMDEWIQYSQFMPTGSFWLRDVVWYETAGYDEFIHVGVDITSGGYFPYDEYHGYSLSGSTMTGTETKPIVLFFEV